MERVLGKPPPPPPPSSSFGNSGRHSGQETITRCFPKVLGVVRDLGEWRPGFYTEFRCASHEHSGLAWGAIFEKVTQNKEIHTFENGDGPKIQKC